MPWEIIITLLLVGAGLYFLMSRSGSCASASLGGGGGRCGHSGHDHAGHDETARDEKQDLTTDRDPVCGMEIRTDRAAASIEYAGKTYHFCSVRCRDQFKNEPTRFVSNEPLAAGGCHEHD